MESTLSVPSNAIPTSLAVLGGTSREFSGVLDALRAELAPVGMVEALLVDRIVIAVARLRSMISLGEDHGAPGPEIERAEQSIDRALDALITARSAKAEGWGHAAPGSSRIDHASLPPLPVIDAPAPIPTEAVEAAPADADGLPWRDRLIFDENVSEESPVVRGTWVTAGQVISLIVDGWSWVDILRNYPELTERDIRACIAYTTEQDGPISL